MAGRSKEKTDKKPLDTRSKMYLVMGMCSLMLLVSVAISFVLVGGLDTAGADSGADAASDSDSLVTESGYNKDQNTIDQTQYSSTILEESEDAGQDYVDETLFLGDSNTARMYRMFDYCSYDNAIGSVGMSARSLATYACVQLQGYSNYVTMAKAVSLMQPRRVILTFGTNDLSPSYSAQDFVENYQEGIESIVEAYPSVDIIVNAIPPLGQTHSNQNLTQTQVDEYNKALVEMCQEQGWKFLNSAEVLKDPSSGFGLSDYYIDGDIHLKCSGLKAVLNYLTTHAYETEDRRPDTSNIPTRTLEYTSNPSDPVAPSSSQAEAGETFQARYRIDQTGGTLTSGDVSGETSLSYDVTADDSVTVTAVPAEGYFFVNWSDGVTTPTRTDSGFKQNLDVTAVFSRASVEITGEGSGILGMNYTFRAKLSGQYANAENLRWYVNGVESRDAAGRTSITFIVDPILANQTYTVYATVSYNGSQVVSNTLTVSFEGGVSSGSSSSSSSSESSSSESASGSSSGSSSSEAASGSSSSAGSSSGASSEDGSQEVSASSSSSASTSRPSSGSSSSRPSSSGSSSGSSSSSSGSSSSASNSSSSRPASSGSSSAAGSSSSSRPSSSSSEAPASSSSSSSSSSEETGRGQALDSLMDTIYGTGD